jgi:hypothetical protein
VPFSCQNLESNLNKFFNLVGPNVLRVLVFHKSDHRVKDIYLNILEKVILIMLPAGMYDVSRGQMRYINCVFCHRDLCVLGMKRISHRHGVQQSRTVDEGQTQA